jgi:hypothetical protein
MQASLAAEVLNDLKKPLEAAISDNLKSFFIYVEKSTGRSISARELQTHYRKFSTVNEDDVLDTATKVVTKTKKTGDKRTCLHKMLNGVNAGKTCTKTAMEGSMFCSHHKNDTPPEEEPVKKVRSSKKNEPKSKKVVRAPKKNEPKSKKVVRAPKKNESDEEPVMKPKRRIRAPVASESESEEDTHVSTKRMTVGVKSRNAPRTTKVQSTTDTPIINLKNDRKLAEDSDSDSIDAAFDAEGSD